MYVFFVDTYTGFACPCPCPCVLVGAVLLLLLPSSSTAKRKKNNTVPAVARNTLTDDRHHGRCDQTNPPIHQPTKQPTNQPIDRLIDRSIDCSKRQQANHIRKFPVHVPGMWYTCWACVSGLTCGDVALWRVCFVQGLLMRRMHQF